jgi:hypothetical protein
MFSTDKKICSVSGPDHKLGTCCRNRKGAEEIQAMQTKIQLMDPKIKFKNVNQGQWDEGYLGSPKW